MVRSGRGGRRRSRGDSSGVPQRSSPYLPASAGTGSTRARLDWVPAFARHGRFVALAQASQSRAAVSLLIVLVVAKAIMLAGHRISISVWTPFVYIWQDVLVAALFGVVVRLARRPVVVWSAYGLTSAWVAVNVPIARELSSPLTL